MTVVSSQIQPVQQVASRRGMLVFALLLCAMFAVAYHPSSRQLLVAGAPVTTVAPDAVPGDIDAVEIPDFASIPDPAERKQLFFEFLQPYIDAQNAKVRSQRQRLLGVIEHLHEGLPLERRDRVFLMELATEYEVEGEDHQADEFLERLLRRVDVIPPSLVLAQAANESAWGTSRFAKEANNFFGQWCYEQGCGLVPNRRRASASHEVKAFNSIEEAVDAYFLNLNTFPSYLDLRLIREELRENARPIDGISLSEGLYSYSERGRAYVRELQSMIHYNELLELDGKVSSQQLQD